MIRVDRLKKVFDHVVAVNDMSFRTGPGEVFGLLGQNGAGKTTTLRMLATLLQPSAGTVFIDGMDVRDHAREIRHRLGIVFEGGVYDRLTARENIRYFGRLYGLRGDELEHRIDTVLSFFDMKDFADKRAGTFSTGMRQRVVIARALVHDPTVILMDEPTAGLDIVAMRVVHDFILEAKAQGKSIVFSSHHMSEVEKVCDRVAIMHRGTIVAEGTIQQMLQTSGHETLEELFIELVEGNR